MKDDNKGRKRPKSEESIAKYLAMQGRMMRVAPNIRSTNSPFVNSINKKSNVITRNKFDNINRLKIDTDLPSNVPNIAPDIDRRQRQIDIPEHFYNRFDDDIDLIDF